MDPEPPSRQLEENALMGLRLSPDILYLFGRTAASFHSESRNRLSTDDNLPVFLLLVIENQDNIFDVKFNIYISRTP